jgi:hypothetical protein
MKTCLLCLACRIQAVCSLFLLMLSNLFHARCVVVVVVVVVVLVVYAAALWVCEVLFPMLSCVLFNLVAWFCYEDYGAYEWPCGTGHNVTLQYSIVNVRGVCVTINNEFWIGWLDLLAFRLQLQSIVTTQINDYLRLATFLIVLRVSSLPLWLTSPAATALNDDFLTNESLFSARLLI